MSRIYYLLGNGKKDNVEITAIDFINWCISEYTPMTPEKESELSENENKLHNANLYRAVYNLGLILPKIPIEDIVNIINRRAKIEETNDGGCRILVMNMQ